MSGRWVGGESKTRPLTGRHDLPGWTEEQIPDNEGKYPSIVEADRLRAFSDFICQAIMAKVMQR